VQDFFLRFAGTPYKINGVPDGWLGTVPESLLRHRIDATQAMSATRCGQLTFEVVKDADELRPPSQGHDLNESSHLEWGDSVIRYQSDWCRGSLEPVAPPNMQLECHSEAAPWFGGLLENALRLMVAYDVLDRGGLLVHSASIVIDGQAHILFGHSGAGKSTTSQIAMDNGFSVMSDDINVLLPANGKWQVVRVPFCGSVGGSHSSITTIPLSGIYSLHKHDLTKLMALTPAAAMSAICGSVPYINQDPRRTEQLLDNAQRLVGEQRVQKLYFTPDPDFLSLLTDA
jgi:hypothetical protein